MRFFALEGIGYGKETAKKPELTRRKAKTCERLKAFLILPQSLPAGAVMPLAFLDYVTPEELEAMVQLHNQEQDDVSWSTVEDLKIQAQQSDINHINPFLGPVSAVVFFYGGRRRTGYVARFCEQK